MISRQQLRENITTAVHNIQGLSVGATVTLSAYEFIYGIQQFLGQKDPHIVEQLTNVPSGAIIGIAAFTAATTLILGDTYLDSKPYKGVADSQEHHP